MNTRDGCYLCFSPIQGNERILIALLEPKERYGTKVIITGNESMFHSVLFRAALFLLGIRHRKNDPYYPR